MLPLTVSRTSCCLSRSSVLSYSLKNDLLSKTDIFSSLGSWNRLPPTDLNTPFASCPIITQITLPEPEVLDFAVDLDSLKFRALKTGIITRIGNVFRDETLKDKLQKDVKSAVEEFVSTPGTMPSKSELLKEMRGLERILSDAYKVKLTFD